MSIKSGMKDYPTSLSTPVDSTAKRVVSKGFQYEPSKKLNQEIWEIPPPTIRTPFIVRDLIGTRQNRVQIVGYLGKKKTGANGTKYFLLARCDCGRYEKRIAQNWRKMKTFDDCCQICRHTEFLKHRGESNQKRDKRVAKMREGK